MQNLFGNEFFAVQFPCTFSISHWSGAMGLQKWLFPANKLIFQVKRYSLFFREEFWHKLPFIKRLEVQFFLKWSVFLVFSLYMYVQRPTCKANTMFHYTIIDGKVDFKDEVLC